MTLTERQEEVLLLVADGLSNAEIGDALDISTRTAKYHVDNLKRRYNVGAEKRRLVVVAQREISTEQAVVIRARIEGGNGDA